MGEVVNEGDDVRMRGWRVMGEVVGEGNWRGEGGGG